MKIRTGKLTILQQEGKENQAYLALQERNREQIISSLKYLLSSKLKREETYKLKERTCEAVQADSAQTQLANNLQIYLV